ncbi:acyl-[acyl-carrier-protein] thioesterase [Bdellovibrio sp. qaytius]|nr:acyl-[acyl-carrier-protein] thioesterase [Bdellovibrio sp. qaytius]
MSEKPSTWTEDYKIASYFVNLRGRAGLYSLLNFIQDVGWMHARQMKVSLEPHQGWVFTRQSLTMNTWPKWNETITIKTWLRPPTSGVFIFRDYEIFSGENKIGECTSTFTVMDMNTRKMVVPDLKKLAAVFREDYNRSESPEKILWQTDVTEIAQFEVRNSDLDMNNHVNNTRYAQWILDAIPLEILKGDAQLTKYEINFLAETKSGDKVTLQKTNSADSAITQFQGVRAADGKPVFTARLHSS